MSDKPISLSKFRKRRARAAARRQADENAVKFGRTKAEKSRDAKDQARAETALDGHRRDAGTGLLGTPDDPETDGSTDP